LTGTLCVFNATRQSFLGLRVSCASTPVARLKGLLGTLRLRNAEGLWTIPSSGIHTVGLFYSIDLVYLDAQNRIIHIVENLSPFRFSPVKIRAHSVLQLAAHAVHASRTQKGDQLVICEPEGLKARRSQLQYTDISS
jgi:uncharacterized protein